MSLIRDLADELQKQDDQLDLGLSVWDRQSQLPIMETIANELGDDQVLAETVLRFVRQKKDQILWAKLQMLLTPEEFNALREQAQAESNQAG